MLASGGYAAARELVWYPALGLYGEFDFESRSAVHDSVAGGSTSGHYSGKLRTVDGATPSATPEPGTIILFATGLAGLIAGKKKFLR